MEMQPVVPGPQNPPEGAGAPPQTPEETITIPRKEYDDLSHRAGVSSQNFERLQKATADLEEARLLLSANNTSTPDPELAGKVGTLEATVKDLTDKLTKADLFKTYPAIEAAWQDFEKYHLEPSNAGMTLAVAAKAFLTEKGLLEPRREGIERPTGGPRVPIASGMTPEEVAHIRSTDYRRYTQMLKDGQIKFQ